MLKNGGASVAMGKIVSAFGKKFVSAMPKGDKRTGISHQNFISGLVFFFSGDSKSVSLEAMRRHLVATFGKEISRSAFWERLSRKRLRNILTDLISKLIVEFSTAAVLGANILTLLGVNAILLIDSSSITLWDGAKKKFPGTRTHAGIKWHACFDLFTGGATWLETSSTSVHDRKCFPPFETLFGKLIIFDLGYWDYGLLISINSASGFFLSRIKINSAIMVKKVVNGIKSKHIGKKISQLNFKKNVGDIVEFIADISADNTVKEFRVIGFWNKSEKKYHWYITNLRVLAAVIYPLYKIRWQIELIFKGCKRSLNLDGRLQSNNENIIEALVLTTIVASLASVVVLKIGREELNTEQKLAVSFQRVYMVTALLARQFTEYLASPSKKYLHALLEKIRLLSAEMFEKNYTKRPTTMMKLLDELVGAS